MFARCLRFAVILRRDAPLNGAFRVFGDGKPSHGARGLRNFRACASIHFTSADFNPTVEDALKTWCKRFKDERISDPLESIANILACSLNSNKISEVYKHRKQILSDSQMEDINRMCEQRLQSMPVQYIVGEWDFRELTLKLRPPVFIPRPETEMLVELVLGEIKEKSIDKVLELCCGSGAISLSLLNVVPNLCAVASDKSKAACELTLENSKNLGMDARLKVHHADALGTGKLLKEKFDVIVSNPPYVIAGEMKSLQPEILLYEDLQALDGGADGLNVVKQIFAVSSEFLNPAGKLFIEVDPSHPQIIRSLLEKNRNLGLRAIGIHRDLCNETRFVEIIRDQTAHN